MIGLVLDVLVLMVLIQVITGDEEGGWGKPTVTALLAAVGMRAASFGAANSPDDALLILFGAVAGVGALVALCCVGLMQIPFSKSLLIAGGFVLFKTVFILLTIVVFS